MEKVGVLAKIQHKCYMISSRNEGGILRVLLVSCLLVTALSFTTTAGSDKLKEFARVAVISTAITKFN